MAPHHIPHRIYTHKPYIDGVTIWCLAMSPIDLRATPHRCVRWLVVYTKCVYTQWVYTHTATLCNTLQHRHCVYTVCIHTVSRFHERFTEGSQFPPPEEFQTTRHTTGYDASRTTHTHTHTQTHTHRRATIYIHTPTGVWHDLLVWW